MKTQVEREQKSVPEVPALSIAVRHMLKLPLYVGIASLLFLAGTAILKLDVQLLYASAGVSFVSLASYFCTDVFMSHFHFD